MKLTLPLGLPDILNIYGAVGFLKENDIAFAQPGEKSFPLCWGTNPSDIKRT